MKIPNFATKSELFKFLKTNKDSLIAEKKYNVKHADAVDYHVLVLKGDEAIKSEFKKSAGVESIKALVVINTTNLLDSHDDVHIQGLWKKSLSEIKRLYLLQEHQMSFDKIITDKVKASVKNYQWAELGFPEFKGETQALLFDSEIDCERNYFMFEQYSKGYVTEHSVGMMYVQLHLCINDEDNEYKEEKANWDKYIIDVANSQTAVDKGYFWAVTEAKLIEGSAVVKGSNYATPTISVNEIKEIEAENITSTKINEPVETTQIEKNYYLFNNLKLT